MMRQTVCGQPALQHTKAGYWENDKIYGRDCRGGRRICKGRGRVHGIHIWGTGKMAYYNYSASMDIAIQSDKGSAGTTGKLGIE